MKQGFTLIELLVVVLIIGILSAVALPQYQTAVERSRAAEALTQMAAIADSMERYHAQHDAWPNTNSFNSLDVDIPTGDCDGGRHGGKYFCVGFGSDGAPASIVATRSRNSHSYTLTTTITPQTDGSYSRTRSCAPVTAEDQEASDYCDAISGGHSTDF